MYRKIKQGTRVQTLQDICSDMYFVRIIGHIYYCEKELDNTTHGGTNENAINDMIAILL